MPGIKHKLLKSKRVKALLTFIQKSLYWPVLKLYYQKPFFFRFTAGLLAFIILATTILPIYDGKNKLDKYDISRVQVSLLSQPVNLYAEKLVFNKKSNKYDFNEGYSPGQDVAGQSYAPKVTAEFLGTEKKTVSIKDPVNEVSVGFSPKFKVGDPLKKNNFIVYPINDLKASTVFTMKGSGVKEDIILFEYSKDTIELKYDLGLSDGLEARIEKDGSLGVYGVDSNLLGSVTTGSDKDAQLLEKARQNGKKTNLVFRIPAPAVLGANKKVQQNTKAWFSLDNKVLTVHSSGLANAKYPLSIDPSVYVETASKLMRGNNETNIDFDVSNELIQKSQTTGARIDAWGNTKNLNTSLWDQATAVAGGYIYSVAGQEVYKKIYDGQGASTFTVPTGVSSITIKTWGAGGGGGAGGGSASGAAGGGAGYVTAVLSVSAGETLNVYVGGKGNGGAYDSGGSGAGGGGSGAGYSSLYRSATPLVVAAGGGGGGGARNATAGGVAGAAGGTTGVAGTTVGNGVGGGAGTPTTGGTGGTGGNNDGSPGSSLTGGAGADGRSSQGTDGSGAIAGLASGGAGGLPNVNTTRAGGGGGGAGYFGGGGGGAPSSAGGNAGGGGGGGSSYTDAGATSVTNTAGSGSTPGNSGDSDRAGSGSGGGGGAATVAGSVGSSGIFIISYTISGNSTATTASVSWAKFNTSSSAVDSPNPGTGACTNWCSNSAYDLPAARRGLSSVAYNGFLYAIGGIATSGCTGTSHTCNTVYIAKLGANGEPSLWHPTGGSAVYWYASTNTLSTERSYTGAVAYNNRLYLLGGRTDATAGGVTTVEFANLLPTGDIGSWSTTGMQALPGGAGKQMHSVQVYNDVIYAIGGFEGVGTSSANLRSAVYYSKLNSDGTMNTWQLTSAFTTARATMGGSFTTIWGAYIYIAGGCSAVNGSGYCTTVSTDVQLASINADGSIDSWNTIIGLSNSRMGYSLIAWQNALYRVGGCDTQDIGTGVCTFARASVDYGLINQDGDASTVATSVASGVAPCSGASPYSCNLPSASIGNVLNGAVIMNGYLYIFGGCTIDDCTTVSAGVTYQAIGSDGSLQKPAACTGSYTDSYCVSSSSLPAALGAPGTAVFNGRIYVVGGFPSITNIYYTTVNNDGSIAAWSSVNTTTIGATDVSYTFAYARANPASAGTNPGNLYIFGGCTSTGSVSCTSQTQTVYKCNLNTTGVPGGCGTGSQLQIGTIPGASGTGLGAHSGAVYANYIYLIGGLAPSINDLATVRYAKFDNSNNVVTVGSGWVEGSNKTVTGRRRGAAFGYNGYLYVVGGYDGTAGVLADIEFAKINVSDGSWGTFSVSAVTINQRWGLTVPVSNSYAYVIGGCIAGAAPSNCTSRTNTIQTFQVYNNNSGAVSAFNAASDDTFAASTDRWGASSTILNGYIYVAGGCTSATDCTTAITDVQYAPISANDGSIGTWTSATNGLPAVRTWGKLVTVGGYLYYMGGQDSTATNEQSTVYYVGTFSSGDITAAWSTASGGIGDTNSQAAQARTKFGVAVWDSRIYVVGGLDGSAAVTSTVYISPRLTSGGNMVADSWSSGTAFNVARFGSAVTAYANNIYSFGGNDGTNYLNDGQFASFGYKTGTISQSGTTVTGSGTTFTSAQVGSILQYPDGSIATISAFSSGTSITVSASKTVVAGTSYVILDGSVGSWTYTTSTPGPISQGEAFAANGYMYIIGGRSATSTCVPNTLIAPISANTTIATSNNPTGVGEWYETNVRYTGDRYGAAVAYSQGKLYLMGGGCTAPLASTRHYYAPVKSQPQVAKYSRLIDTDTDVFPNSWLMNGLDNSVGARWQAKYKTMHDTSDGAGQQNPNEDCGTSATMALMTNYGQETNYGDVTLGDVASYTPKESGGGNINCARYYYFSISIDSSQTFGYPEDVSRGPTIYDISLFFTADPSKRLRHGKTFTGGEQQPLDTPCRQSVDPQCPLP